ncbi:MAG: phytanoyl-CoA dioxygenase family protein [Bryobacteraceae bacterium]
MRNTPQTEELQQKGYIVLQAFMTPAILQELRDRVEQLYQEEGGNAGAEFRQEANTRRLANLVAKGRIFESLVHLPEIMAYVSSVLGPDFKLSSLNARSANPQSDSGQPLHADMGAIADEKGYWVCNTVWMLDDFTPRNGAIRVIPGSHRWRKLPQDVLEDLTAVHPDEILLTAPAGTVVVMNAHMWHGGTANRTDAPRRAVHGFYCRRDKPQQQYQKRLIPAAIQNRFSPELRWVLALDDSLNDQLSANVDRPSGFLK